MHNFRPLASYRYDTAIVGADKLIDPPAAPRLRGLIRDEQLGYYLYEMAFTDLKGHNRHLTGVFGILEISRDAPDSPLEVNPSGAAYQPDHILVHEQTISSGTNIAQDGSDTSIARPGAGPIWAISAQNRLRTSQIRKESLLASVTDNQGVTHNVWHILDLDQQRRIESAVHESQLIIADGHHRIARAMKLLTTSLPGSTIRLLCFVTDLDPLQAEIRPIHRCFKTTLNSDEVLSRLQNHFEIKQVDSNALSNANVPDAALVLIGNSMYAVKPYHGGAKQNDAVTAQAIAKLLEARSTQYITDARKLRERVLADSNKIGLQIRPITINQIRLAAFGKHPLPPKSTMFYPKPLPGLIFGDKLNL